jgi:hypothetical protein
VRQGADAFEGLGDVLAIGRIVHGKGFGLEGEGEVEPATPQLFLQKLRGPI